MTRFRFRLAGALAALATLAALAGSAQAATVVLVARDGHTRVVENPYLSGIAADPNLPVIAPAPPWLSAPAEGLTFSAAARLPLATVARAGERRTVRKHRHGPRPVTFAQALLRLRNSGSLAPALYSADLRSWRAALVEERHLPSWRAAQLADVTATLDEMATYRQVTVSRLPVLMLTLANNATYWRRGQRLANGTSVQFQGSELVWQYYAGSGIQLQVLHTFGEGDGFYEAGPSDYPKLVTLMSEMIPLAVRRGGGLAWEYYFNWEGGRPPWVSAMAQATGLEALTNAYLATGNEQYLTVAHNALGLFQTPPPVGVAVKTQLGTRYLQYSFTPKTNIINAFLQTLLGLYDYGQVSQDPLANTLYADGNQVAEAELPRFVTGGWSLYQPGEPDPLNYHVLVTGFLKLLCQKTQIPVYCSTYQLFAGDLLLRPQLTLLTTTAPAGRRFALRFALNKYAEVGVALGSPGHYHIYTKRYFLAGTRAFPAPKLRPGKYRLAMSVTDPVGHYAQLATTLSVCRGGCPQTPAPLLPSTGAVPTVSVPVPPPTTTPTVVTTTTTTTTTPTTTTTTTTQPTGGNPL